MQRHSAKLTFLPSVIAMTLGKASIFSDCFSILALGKDTVAVTVFLSSPWFFIFCREQLWHSTTCLPSADTKHSSKSCLPLKSGPRDLCWGWDSAFGKALSSVFLALVLGKPAVSVVMHAYNSMGNGRCSTSYRLVGSYLLEKWTFIHFQLVPTA